MKTVKLAMRGCLATLACLLGLLGCTPSGGGGGGSGDGGRLGATRVVVPLGILVGEIELKAGEPVTFRNTFAYPTVVGPFENITINMADTLKTVTVTPTGAPNEKTTSVRQQVLTTQTTYRIAPASEIDTVCETGVAYGPFTVVGNEEFQPVGVEPETATLTEASVSVVNAGEFAVCVEVISRADATMNINGLAVDLTPTGGGGEPDDCDEAVTADFSGPWDAVFQCTNSCGEGFGGEFSVVITQIGRDASYSDDEATFAGTVCGNVFSFEAIDASFTETGTLTLNPDGTASRQGSYRGIEAPFCSGDCIDTFTRPDTSPGGCAAFGEPCTAAGDCCDGLPCVNGECI
ncbi:MAG: hypothetical protein ACE5HE_09270 [Phycisphaerae bacterium]